MGGPRVFIASLGSWRSDGSDGPACQQPSLRSQGNLPSTCHNDLQLSPLSVKGHSKKKWDRRGLFGLAPSACSGVWVSWELGLRWGLRELQVGCGPPSAVCRSEPQSVASQHTPAGENGPVSSWFRRLLKYDLGFDLSSLQASGSRSPISLSAN